MSITLGKRSLKKGRVSLYIDICYKGKRKKEYLGIIMQRPDTPEIRKQNKRKMLLAQQIKAKKELEFLRIKYEQCEYMIDEIPKLIKHKVIK